MVRLVSPAGTREAEVSGAFWWTLLLGPIYFSYHKMWLHTLISAVLAVATSGISMFIYPFFAERLIISHYKGMGWKIQAGVEDKYKALEKEFKEKEKEYKEKESEKKDGPGGPQWTSI